MCEFIILEERFYECVPSRMMIPILKYWKLCVRLQYLETISSGDAALFKLAIAVYSNSDDIVMA